jgi:hypothetical protein
MHSQTRKGKGVSRIATAKCAVMAWVLFFGIYVLGVMFFFKRDVTDVDASNNAGIYIGERGNLQGNVIYPSLITAPDHSYPVFKNLLDVVTEWNPDNPEVPEDFVETLQHFNYSDPIERSYAEKFRNAEVPFKVYNVPDVEEVRRKWSTSYLKKVMKPSLRVEKSKDNHFMYFKDGRHNPAGWEPPQQIGSMGFMEWYKKAQEADLQKLNHTESHIYLTIGSSNLYENTFFSKGNKRRKIFLATRHISSDI